MSEASRAVFVGILCGIAMTASASAQMQWQRENPVHRPAGRWDHALASDLHRARILLFGGRSPTGLLGDTWEWDGWDWIAQAPSTSPAARGGHAMAYDTRRREVVLFGGRTATAVSGQTWIWDGASWSQRFPAHAPSPREGAALACDAERNVLLLFGGSTASGASLADTWIFDGNDWTSLSPPHVPPARTSAGMAFDERRARVVMFSGGDPDVWEWDGSDWSARVAPSPWWTGGSMAYDRRRERSMSWNGIATPFGVMSEWDGDLWLPWTSLPQPGTRESQALAWDEARGAVLLFAGWYFHSALIYNDTWHWVQRTRGGSESHGSGCPGTLGVPALGAFGAPILGDRHFALQVTAARPDAVSIVALSAQRASEPLPGGCMLAVAPPWIELVVTTDPAGRALANAPIPLDSALRGAEVFAQAFVQDPRGAFFAVAAISAGLRVTIGD